LGEWGHSRTSAMSSFDGAHDFIFTFYKKSMHLSCTIFETQWNIWRKSNIFPTPRASGTHNLGWPQWNTKTFGIRKLESLSYHATLFACWYTPCLKKTSHLWLAITLTRMNEFWYFFGRNVSNKVDNQKTLYYATFSNLCFCATWQNGETRKSHFYSAGLCYTHNAPVRCLPERKSCYLWCVW